MRRSSIFLISLLFAAQAHAVSIEPPLADEAHEAVAQSTISQLRCVVCEGQSLADSDASFAREMRAEIRRMADTGQSEAEIIGYFRERYGARILLTPPLMGDTVILWAGPLLLVVFGGALLWTSTRRRKV